MLELPPNSALTEQEKGKYLQFQDGDGPQNYIGPLYNLPFGDVLEFARMLPPLDRQGNPPENFPFPVTNWENWLQGYKPWAIPEILHRQQDDDGGSMSMMESMFLDSYQCSDLENPTKQLMKLFAAPIQREMKRFQKTDAYANLTDKVLVLKIQLSLHHTSLLSCDDGEQHVEKLNDPNAAKVWRLVTVFCDTMLDSFHDQILAPAMGWRRHYHAYRFIVPTNGAVFGPNQSDSIDMMWAGACYMLPVEDYDLRHVLRKKGDRLGFVYDLGDNWCHTITVLDIVEKGAMLVSVHDPDIPDLDAAPVKVTGNMLLAGQINCPPEDSHGEYYKILKEGPSFQPEDRSINWEEHGIRKAFDFDLKAHQKRFQDAVQHRKNPVDGNLVYSFNPEALFHGNDDGGGGGTSSAAAATLTTTTQHPTWAMRGFLNNNNNNNGRQQKSSEKGRRHKQGVAGHAGLVEVVGKGTMSKNRCAACGKQKGSNAGLKLFDCSRCHQVAYCGKSCQKAHWKKHKKECGAKVN